MTGATGEGGARAPGVRGRAAVTGAAVSGLRAAGGAPPAPEAAPATGTGSEGQTREGRRRLLAADRMELTGLDAQWPKVRVERVHLARPRVRIERDRAGRFPIADIVQSLRPNAAPASSARPAAKSATTGALALEIGEIVVEQGRVRFDDASVAPPARLRVGPLALTANDVTGPGRQPARVQLSPS